MNIENEDIVLQNLHIINGDGESKTVTKTISDPLEFPLESSRYAKIAEDINKNKKTSKNNSFSDKNKNSFSKRMKDMGVNKEKENKRYMHILKSLSFKNSSNLNNNNFYPKQSKNSSQSLNSDVKTLHVDIKEMLREILFEEKEKRNNLRAHSSRIENRKNITSEKFRPHSKFDSYKDFNENVEDILSDSFDINNIKRIQNKSTAEISETQLKSHSKENSRLSSTPLNTNFHRKTNSINKNRHVNNNQMNKSLPNLQLNPPTSYHFTDFDFAKVSKSKIKFSYLWDLMDIYDKRKKFLADRDLNEFVKSSSTNRKSKSKPNSKSNSKSQRNSIEMKEKKSKEKRDQIKLHTYKKIYGSLKTADSNYLANYFITKKNKLLEEILSKSYSTLSLQKENYGNSGNSGNYGNYDNSGNSGNYGNSGNSGNYGNSCNYGNPSISGDKTYRKSIESLDTLNKIKNFNELKIKNEIKITDESERITKMYDQEPIREETEENLLSESMINNSDLLKELTKGQSSLGTQPKELTFSSIQFENEHEGITSPINKNILINLYDLNSQRNNENNADTLEEDEVIQNIQADVPVYHSLNKQKNGGAYMNPEPKEKSYDQRLKELIKVKNTESEDFITKTKKVLEKNRNTNTINIKIYEVANI